MLVAMFVIELTYKVPLSRIDANLRALMKFLERYGTTGRPVGIEIAAPQAVTLSD